MQPTNEPIEIFQVKYTAVGGFTRHVHEEWTYFSKARAGEIAREWNKAHPDATGGPGEPGPARVYRTGMRFGG